MADPEDGYDYVDEPVPEEGGVEELVPAEECIKEPTPKQDYLEEQVSSQAQDQYSPQPPPKKQVSIIEPFAIIDASGSPIGKESEISVSPSEADGPALRQSRADDIRMMKMRRASQSPSMYSLGGNIKKKTIFILFCKSFVMVMFVVCTISIVTYYIIYGFGDPEPEYEEPDYQIQQVLPGRLQALSLSGLVAAIKDDFDVVQMWNHMGSTEAPFWKRMGQPFDVMGEVSLSGNGTILAFVDKTDRRPHILGFHEEKNLWLKRDAPLIICDELSMDVDATVLSVGVYNRLDIGASQDFIVSYTYDGTQWTEFANRLELGSIISFAMSPTARYILASTAPETGSPSSILNTFRLSIEQDQPECLSWKQRNAWTANRTLLHWLKTYLPLRLRMSSTCSHTAAEFGGRIYCQWIIRHLRRLH
jgi:hypothetical protein